MRVQLAEYQRQDVLCHLIVVDAVHIVLLYLLKHQLEFVPAMSRILHGQTVRTSVHEIRHGGTNHKQNQCPQDIS